VFRGATDAAHAQPGHAEGAGQVAQAIRER
jgi:hypothetical protein